MLKKIAVSQLRLGMHLHKLDGPWLKHSFWRTRFVVEVRSEHRQEFERRLAGHDCAAIGSVQARPRLELRDSSSNTCIDLELEALRAAHQGGFQG